VRFRRSSLLPIALLALILPAYAASQAGSGRSPSAHLAKVTQLVIDTQFDQLTADPGRDASNSSRYIRGWVYDNLTAFKPKLVNGKYTVTLTKPDPWLAKSYSVDKSGKVWTFKLRKVVFSDGTPLTSADVVWSFRRVKNLKAAPAILTQTFANVRAVDPLTVQITTTIPNPAVPYILTHKALGVINSTVARANGATDAANAATKDKAQAFFDKNSLGSGPYILQSFSATGETVLVRNPRFWGTKPFYERLVFRNVKPEIARLNIASGRSDIALGMTPDQAKTLPKSIKVYTAPSTTVFYMQANFGGRSKVSPVASNPKVWEAIRFGLDYDKMVRIVGGGAVQACGLLPREFLGALPPTACIHRDLNRARAALKAAGVTNPTLTLEFPTDFTLEGVSFQTISQAVQADLKDVGINVVLKGAPLATWLPRWIKAVPELTQGAQDAIYPDPNSAAAYLPTGYRGGYAGYAPTDAPDLTALGVKAQQTVNPQKRAALYRQLQLKLNAESPMIPQFQPSTVIAAASRIHGIVVVPAFFIDPTVFSE
jgi:peptide/nickel transport system substrate-binding protein